MTTYDIKCVFCGLVTGTIQKREVFDHVPTNDELGISDSRCTPCQEEHGRYEE